MKEIKDGCMAYDYAFSIDNLLNVDKLYDDKIIRSNKFKPCDSAVAH